MRIAVTGSTGLIGTALVAELSAAGHQVVRLVRRPPTGPGEVCWDPPSGAVDLAGLAGVEAVVNLAGAGIGDRRWTAARKREIRDSRVLGTRTLVRALDRLSPRPTVLVSGSAVGYYGARDATELTEDAEGGEGFLPDVVRAWEAEALRAGDLGCRVALARTGLVLARSGGAAARLLPLIRLGLGGPLGSGRQWWSWITLADEVAALRLLVEGDLSGPVNLTAPQPLPNAEVVRALGAAAGRPTLLRAPGIALRLALGELAEDILTGQRVIPARLLGAGFRFRHPTVDVAASWLFDDAARRRP